MKRSSKEHETTLLVFGQSFIFIIYYVYITLVNNVIFIHVTFALLVFVCVSPVGNKMYVSLPEEGKYLGPSTSARLMFRCGRTFNRLQQ